MIMDEVSDRIQFILKERKMTPFELAGKCEDVAQTSVYNAVKGSKNATVFTLSNICEGLDVSMSEFFDWNGEVKITPSKKEKILLENFRSLDREKQGRVMGYLKALMEEDD